LQADAEARLADSLPIARHAVLSGGMWWAAFFAEEIPSAFSGRNSERAAEMLEEAGR